MAVITSPPRRIQRSYSGGAKALVLAAPLTATATSFGAVGNFSTWPTGATGPYTITMDPGLPTEEKMLIGSFSHVTGIFQVAITGTKTGRGFDGTAAIGHVPQVRTTPTQIRPTWSAIEAYLANQAVFNLLGKITTKGQVLVGTGTGTTTAINIGAKGGIFVVGATTLPFWLAPGTANQILSVAGTGHVLHWTTPSALFGLNSTANKIKNAGAAAPAAGTTTLAARADHVHSLTIGRSGSPYKGAIPGTPHFRVQTVTGVFRTDTGGRLKITFPTAFANALTAVHVSFTVSGTVVGAPPTYSLRGDTTLGFASIVCFNPATGVHLPINTTLGIMLTAIGC